MKIKIPLTGVDHKAAVHYGYRLMHPTVGIFFSENHLKDRKSIIRLGKNYGF